MHLLLVNQLCTLGTYLLDRLVLAQSGVVRDAVVKSRVVVFVLRGGTLFHRSYVVFLSLLLGS